MDLLQSEYPKILTGIVIGSWLRVDSIL